MNRLEDAINNCAQKIADFHFNNKSIGTPAAIKRIEKWLNNFSEFAGFDELLIKILDSISFLSDDQIANSVIGYIEEYSAVGMSDENFNAIVNSFENRREILL